MKTEQTQKITNIEYGVKINVNQIRPNPWNPNVTTDREQEAIQESFIYSFLKQFYKVNNNNLT